MPSSPRTPTTATHHPLPFERLSPAEFERLCLWLVERQGYEGAEALGEAGSDQGRDVAGAAVRSSRAARARGGAA